MNFENYNKIYQEILDAENNTDISANYLLNKYEIKNDEELLKILHQIKKNEYISSQNGLISKLIKELNADEEIIDINQVVDIKENIINKNYFYDEDNKTMSNEIKAEDIINSTKDKLLNKTRSNKKYLFIILPAFILVVIIILFITNKEENIEKDIVVGKEVIKTDKNKKEKIESEKIEKDVIKEVKESTKVEENKNDFKEELEIIEVANNFEEIKINENSEKLKEPPLNPLVDISEYINKFKYEDGELIYNEERYKEGDTIMGYKIYKLTPVYIKLEDEQNEIRKQFLLKK